MITFTIAEFESQPQPYGHYWVQITPNGSHGFDWDVAYFPGFRRLGVQGAAGEAFVWRLDGVDDTAAEHGITAVGPYLGNNPADALRGSRNRNTVVLELPL